MAIVSLMLCTHVEAKHSEYKNCALWCARVIICVWLLQYGKYITPKAKGINRFKHAVYFLFVLTNTTQVASMCVIRPRVIWIIAILPLYTYIFVFKFCVRRSVLDHDLHKIQNHHFLPVGPKKNCFLEFTKIVYLNSFLFYKYITNWVNHIDFESFNYSYG